jgi:hypothetical protein
MLDPEPLQAANIKTHAQLIHSSRSTPIGLRDSSASYRFRR